MLCYSKTSCMDSARYFSNAVTIGNIRTERSILRSCSLSWHIGIVSFDNFYNFSKDLRLFSSWTEVSRIPPGWLTSVSHWKSGFCLSSRASSLPGEDGCLQGQPCSPSTDTSSSLARLPEAHTREDRMISRGWKLSCFLVLPGYNYSDFCSGWNLLCSCVGTWSPGWQ